MSAVLKVSPHAAEELLLHIEAEKLLAPLAPKLRKAIFGRVFEKWPGAGVELCSEGQFG